MSNLKISENLFLDSQELNRLVQFLKQDGYLKLFRDNSALYGVLRRSDDLAFANFKVEVGSNTEKIAINTDSYAIDSNGEILLKTAEDNLSIPTADQWYWIYVERATSPIEKGTVNVAADGVVTGVGTSFTEILRGSPNRPSKISFPNASSNISEYTVQQVNSDTSLILAGSSFSVENDLQYACIGTFSPQVVPTQIQKFIYQYDSCNLTFVLETITNTPPAVVEGQQFLIARVRLNGSTVEIQDARTSIYQSKDLARLLQVDTGNNPLIGVDSVRWNVEQSTKDSNIVQISWGFSSNNWTVDYNLRLLTLNGGSGGRFKDTSYFTNGDFDGWRVYSEETGKYVSVIQSSKTGTQINLLLDNAISANFLAGTKVIVVPPTDVVEIRAIPDVQNNKDQLLKTQTFDNALGSGLLKLIVPSQTSYSYQIHYRYRASLGSIGIWRQLPTDSVGYYDEDSFEESGLLKSAGDRTRVPYQIEQDLSGNIVLQAHPNHYANFTFNIDLGDLLRVATKTLSFADAQIDLTTGQSAQVQYIDGSVTLGNDLIFNLTRENTRAGNKFILIFDADIDLNGSRVSIYDNFGAGGSILKTLTDTDIDYMKYPEQKLVVECYYTGTLWISTVLENDAYNLWDIKSSINVPSGAFDNTGLGQVSGYYGWALPNGNNGTPNIPGAVLLNQDVNDPTANVVGLEGGSSSIQLADKHLPPHTHDGSGLTTDTHEHSHKIYMRDSGSRVGKHRDAQYGRGDDDRLGESLRNEGENTDIDSHNHAIIGQTGDGGFNNESFDNRSKFYTVAMMVRVPKV